MVPTLISCDEAKAVLHCVHRAAGRTCGRSADADDVVGEVLLRW